MHSIVIAGLVIACMLITGLWGYPMGLARLVFYPVFELIFRRYGRNPFSWCPSAWLDVMRKLAYNSLHVNWRYTGDYIFAPNRDQIAERLRRPGLKVLVVNHPCNYFSAAPPMVAKLVIGPRMGTVLKHQHALGPVGAGLWAAYSGVFVNRLFTLDVMRHYPTLRQWLRQWSYNLLHYQLKRLATAAAKANQAYTLLVFSDERWTTPRWAAKVEDNYYPGVPRDRVYLMRAKSGALHAVLQACGGLDVEIVDMAICVNRHPAEIEGWFAFAGLRNADIAADTQLVTDELMALAPGGDLSQIDRTALQSWLDERQANKNARYHAHLTR